MLAVFIALALYLSRGRLKSVLIRNQVSPTPASVSLPTAVVSTSPIIYPSSSEMPNTGVTLPATGF